MKKTKTITIKSVVARSDDLLASEVDGDVVMMSVKQGTYSGLDSVGTEIWKMLERPMRVSDLCAGLMERYAVDQESCERDVLAFLNDLASDDTVTMVEAL